MKLAVRIILHCAAIARSRINCTALFPCSPFLHYYYSCCGRLQLNGWAVCKYSQHPPPTHRHATRLTYCPAILPTVHVLPTCLPGYPPVMTHPPSSRASSLSVSPPFWSKTQHFFFLYSIRIASFFFTRFELRTSVTTLMLTPTSLLVYPMRTQVCGAASRTV